MILEKGDKIEVLGRVLEVSEIHRALDNGVAAYQFTHEGKDWCRATPTEVVCSGAKIMKKTKESS